MKKNKLVTIFLVSGLLGACSTSTSGENDINEYKNPLNNYEKTLVQKSVIENVLDISSVQTSITSSKDDEKLYGSNGSKSISKSDSTSSKITAIYSNKIIVENETVTSSTLENGIRITESYELKNMLAVLSNPEEQITSGKVTSKYGLYKKSFYKASGAKEFGATYSLINGNFANEDDVDYKWNNYLITNLDKVSSVTYSYFKNDDNNINALYSYVSKSTITNPLYRYDNTKSVTAVTSNVSKLSLETIDDGYRIKNLSTTNTVDYMTDYYGNSLDDGNISSYEETSSYFYGKTIFAGVPFEAEEYWNLNSYTPVLESSLDGTTKDKTTFTNITRDYQQTYGNDNFAFELTFQPTDNECTYRLTDVSGKTTYSPSQFTMADNIGLTLNDDSSFNLSENSTYHFVVELKPDFSLKAITVSLK